VRQGRREERTVVSKEEKIVVYLAGSKQKEEHREASSRRRDRGLNRHKVQVSSEASTNEAVTPIASTREEY